VGFWGMWCHVVAEVVGGFHKLVAGGYCGCGIWICGGGGVAVRMEALASVPTSEGSRWCTGAMRALLALYLYAAFYLQHIELRLTCK
jgi:hypothetical protein